MIDPEAGQNQPTVDKPFYERRGTGQLFHVTGIEAGRLFLAAGFFQLDAGDDAPQAEGEVEGNGEHSGGLQAEFLIEGGVVRIPLCHFVLAIALLVGEDEADDSLIQRLGEPDQFGGSWTGVVGGEQMSPLGISDPDRALAGPDPLKSAGEDAIDEGFPKLEKFGQGKPVCLTAKPILQLSARGTQFGIGNEVQRSCRGHDS